MEPEYGFTTSDRGFVVLDHEYLVNDLGVLIESDLTFDEHIHEKINVASKMLEIIWWNFIDLDKNCVLLLYKSLIRSHLEYAGSVWNSYKKGLIEPRGHSKKSDQTYTRLKRAVIWRKVEVVAVTNFKISALSGGFARDT